MKFVVLQLIINALRSNLTIFLLLWKMPVFFFASIIKILNQTRRHFMVLLVVVGLAFAVQISCSPKCGVRFLCYLVFSKKV